MNEVDVNKLKLSLVNLQQFFREQIVPLPDTDFRERSYRTEISKQLHLLQMDVMFLQGARQATTVNHRITSVKERLQIIRQYSQVIVG